MVFEWLGAYDCSTSFAARALSTCLCVKPHLSASPSRELKIGSVIKSQAASKKKPDGGLNEVAYSQPKATQKHHPFRASGHTQNTKATNMKCKPNCGPGGTSSKTRLASCSAGILAGSTGEHWRALRLDTGRILGRIDPPARDTQRDTKRDPLASYSGILSGIHCRAALAGYSAGFTGEPLWRDTRRDPLASRSGRILGGIHWRAALAGYSMGSTGELLWRDTGWWRGVEASQTRIPT